MKPCPKLVLWQGFEPMLLCSASFGTWNWTIQQRTQVKPSYYFECSLYGIYPIATRWFSWIRPESHVPPIYPFDISWATRLKLFHHALYKAFNILLVNCHVLLVNCHVLASILNIVQIWNNCSWYKRGIQLDIIIYYVFIHVLDMLIILEKKKR